MLKVNNNQSGISPQRLNLYMTRMLAKQLWPDEPKVALLAPWVLIATLLWTLFATGTMFDILLSNCVLLGILGLVWVRQDKEALGWGSIRVIYKLSKAHNGPTILAAHSLTPNMPQLKLINQNNRFG
jgi:hypothetical protein